MDVNIARAAEPTDAEAIAELVRAYTRAVVGYDDYTLDDARDELADPDTQCRVVLDAAGRVTGFATAYLKGDHLDIDVVSLAAPVARDLIGWALDHARSLGRPLTIAHGVYRSDKALRNLLSEQGFRVVTVFHRMRVDHDGPVGFPQPPPGLSLRVATDPAVRPAAHHVLMTSFADHFAHVAKPYDEWHDAMERKTRFDWSQLWVAELDGRAMGVVACEDRFVAEENCGYVAELGVLPEARGRGIAKYLLHHAFATDSKAGRTGTILHVDSNNTTPALGLYTSVGMRPVVVIDVLQRTVDTETVD